MRLFALLILCIAGSHALAQSDSTPKRQATALGALKLVPEEQSAYLVSIFAREGNPAPDRWYFVMYDSSQPNGVRECVVSGNKLVASRALSQFVQTLTPADVVGKGGLKVDSDQASQIALEYAKANNVSIASINYESKQEPPGVPIWKLVCFNELSNPLGELRIAADSAHVISHDGFALEPKPAPAKLAEDPAPSPQKKKKGVANPPGGLGGKIKHFFIGH